MSVTGSANLAQAGQTVGASAVEQAANGGFITPGAPNIVDFLNWLAASVQIPAAALPAGAPWPQYALTQAIGLVLNPPYAPAPVMYTLAVYNCATHLVYAMTPDQPGQNYFATARSTKGYGLIAASTGLVAATSDESTSTTLASPEWAKGLTVAQLGFFKTPWGREYLSWQQSYGPTIVALS